MLNTPLLEDVRFAMLCEPVSNDATRFEAKASLLLLISVLEIRVRFLQLFMLMADKTESTSTAHDNDHDFQTVTRTMKPRKNRKGKHRALEPERKKNLVTLLSERRAALRASGYAEQCRSVSATSLVSSWAEARCLELLAGSWPTSTDPKHAEVETGKHGRFKRCLCFGLGSLRDSPKSQLQLTLLQELLLGFEVSCSRCSDGLNISENHT